MQAFITHTGYLAVFLLMVPESACVPIPSEVTMSVGGFLAAQGTLNVWVVGLVGALANLVGALIAYAVGGTFVDLNYFDIFYQLVAVVVLLKSLAPKAPERATAASSSGPRGPLGRGAVVSPEG